ncbi:hypothetical protein OTU49_003207, partial [Cherax quadricarinatus]
LSEVISESNFYPWSDSCDTVTGRCLLCNSVLVFYFVYDSSNLSTKQNIVSDKASSATCVRVLTIQQCDGLRLNHRVDELTKARAFREGISYDFRMLLAR